MPTINEGDRVRILRREPTEDDVKSGLYFAHFGGMTGTVKKLYNKVEAAIEVEPESLTSEIRKRHEEVRGQMKTKWLDGLSEEGRNRLTEREKDFILRYMILTGIADLEKAGPKQQPPAPPPATPAPTAVADPEDSTSLFAGDADNVTDNSSTKRKTLAEIEADEEAELKRRKGE